MVHFGALYFVSEAGIVLSRHCPYVNFFSVLITKPWNPFHSSKYILVLIFLFVFCMEVLPEKITFASTQDEPHIGYFWRGGGVGREVVPSCPQISREIVCADLPISSIFRRPTRGDEGQYFRVHPNPAPWLKPEARKKTKLCLPNTQS